MLNRLDPTMTAMEGSVSDWTKALEEHRRQKDGYFRMAEDSPIPEEERHGFKGLQYFPPDPNFRFPVTLRPVEDRTPFTMEVSQGRPREMVRKGVFEFVVAGATCRLFAYGPTHGSAHESLFVPFRDGTSGKESYGAGRYLDLETDPRGEYVLDFNEAYNPYCAYSEHYSCPLPPAENWLRVPIRAGERYSP